MEIAAYVLLRKRRLAGIVLSRVGEVIMSEPRPVILLLENDATDIFFFRRALGRLGYQGTIKVVAAATEARSYLEQTGEFADAEYSPRPDLIVSDMKLIGSTGNEFLEWLRHQDKFRGIPVVMLSGSALPEERLRSELLGAREFLVKTESIDEMTDKIRSVLSHLPPQSSAGLP
jgi:CheY-like chemotaxis protein